MRTPRTSAATDTCAPQVVVTNTPKTLREILPTLFGLLLGCLASTNFDKRQVAARALGDLVRKVTF